MSVEKHVKTLVFRGVEFELVERPDVIWVGCVDYAKGNEGESDISATLRRYQELVSVEKRARLNPDWSAAISINYKSPDKPCGLMFAQETSSAEQDARYEQFVQPGGLWLRVHANERAESVFFGRHVELYEYFADAGVLQKAAVENGYVQNPDIDIEIEYHRHTGNDPGYAYIAVVEAN